MKKNESKVTNLVATKVAEQLEGIKNSKTAKASAPKAKKTKKELVQDAQEAATNFANAKLVELSPKTKTSKKEQVVKEVKEQVGGQAVLGRQTSRSTPWLTERHGYDPTLHLLGRNGDNKLETNSIDWNLQWLVSKIQTLRNSRLRLNPMRTLKRRSSNQNKLHKPLLTRCPG